MSHHSSAGSSGESPGSSVFETSRDLAGVFAGVGAELNGFPGTDSSTKIWFISMSHMYESYFRPRVSSLLLKVLPLMISLVI